MGIESVAVYESFLRRYAEHSTERRVVNVVGTSVIVEVAYGFGLPSWGCFVVPPISTIAGPRASSGEGISACLSMPALVPIGFAIV